MKAKSKALEKSKNKSAHVHKWMDADNEGIYGKEMCMSCGKRQSK